MFAELFQSPESLNLLGFLVLVAAAVLLALGLTGRVVVYNDGADLALNFGIVLIPLAALLYVEMGAPPDEVGQAAARAYYSQSWVTLVFALSLAGSLACALGTAWISIRENGLLLGAAVAVLKIAVAVLTLALIAFWFMGQGGKQKRSLAANLLFMGATAWLLSLLVNGDKVRDRRGA